MFIVVYRWRLKPGQESRFIEAWSKLTRLLLGRGSFGSRLHRGENGIWLAYAQWPSAEARAQAFETPVDPEAMRAMREAIAESFPEQRLEVVADFLALPGGS